MTEILLDVDSVGSTRYGGVLELVEDVPSDQVENALDRVCGKRFVSLGSIEESDEHGGFSDDEDRHPPHLVRSGVPSVLIANRRERPSRVDFGHHRIRVDSTAAQHD